MQSECLGVLKAYIQDEYCNQKKEYLLAQEEVKDCGEKWSMIASNWIRLELITRASFNRSLKKMSWLLANSFTLNSRMLTIRLSLELIFWELIRPSTTLFAYFEFCANKYFFPLYWLPLCELMNSLSFIQNNFMRNATPMRKCNWSAQTVCLLSPSGRKLMNL